MPLTCCSSNPAEITDTRVLLSGGTGAGEGKRDGANAGTKRNLWVLLVRMGLRWFPGRVAGFPGSGVGLLISLSQEEIPTPPAAFGSCGSARWAVQGPLLAGILASHPSTHCPLSKTDHSPPQAGQPPLVAEWWGGHCMAVGQARKCSTVLSLGSQPKLLLSFRKFKSSVSKQEKQIVIFQTDCVSEDRGHLLGTSGCTFS